MSNNEKILEIVKTVRNKAKNEEILFEAKNRKIQQKTIRSINIYSDTAVSETASIAKETREACDEFYVSLQSYVGLIDAQCKPLLTPDVPLSTIKSVWDLIAWLNKRSNLEVTFSASLNGSSKREFADVDYSPSIANKMIEKEWANRYKLSPDYEKEQIRVKEEKAAKDQEIADANKKCKNKIDEEKETYLKGNKEREAMISDANQKVAVFETDLEKHIAVLSKKFETEKTKIINQHRNKLKEAESQYAALGFFKFAEKKTVKTQISELNEKISRLESPHASANFAAELKQKAADAQKAYKEDLDNLINNSFSKQIVTVVSDSPNVKPLEPCNDEDQEFVLGYIEDFWKEYNEIYEEMSDTYSSSRFSSIMAKLKRAGYIIRMESLGKVYYALAGTLYQEQIEVWVKSSDAPKTLPQPPKVENVLKV